MFGRIHSKAVILLCGMIGFYMPCKCTATPASDLEYEIKSACILNFLKFITLPEASSPGKSEAINIALIGTAPAAEIILKTLNNKTVNNRAIKVRVYANTEEVIADRTKNQVAYFLLSKQEVLSSHIMMLRTNYCLTVSETLEFCQKGGMINFRMDGGKIRFDINPSAARLANITISSQLLKLANIIEMTPVVTDIKKKNNNN